MKNTIFLGTSKDNILDFPVEVRKEIGFAIYTAQGGGKAINATPLICFKGSGVVEIISNHSGDTFRSVYTTRFGNTVYVLHAFQKKSKSGVATPPKELEMVRRRLKQAEIHYLEELKKEAETKNGRQQTG